MAIIPLARSRGERAEAMSPDRAHPDAVPDTRARDRLVDYFALALAAIMPALPFKVA